MRTVTIKLPDEMEARVRRLAVAAGTTRSEVVRRAIELLCEQSHDSAGSPPSSFISANHDLIGACVGPADLTSNPAYLDDFGR